MLRVFPSRHAGGTMSPPQRKARRRTMGKIAISQARIEANRRNAAFSTGPRTPEGKDESRRNSLIHGLTGSGVVQPKDERATLEARMEQWSPTLGPLDESGRIAMETAVVESLRIERCRVEERIARVLRGRKARDPGCWADDRRADVAKFARMLPKRPADTMRKLSTTSHGCDWLLDRWMALGQSLQIHGTWNDRQRSQILDLLGVDLDLRDETLPHPADAPPGIDPIDHRANLVADHLESLTTRKAETLDPIEEEHRQAAIQGLDTVNDPGLALIRRYENAAHRRLKWALELLERNQGQQNEPILDPSISPDFVDQATPATESEPSSAAHTSESTKQTHPCPVSSATPCEKPTDDFSAMEMGRRDDEQVGPSLAEDRRIEAKRDHRPSNSPIDRGRAGAGPACMETTRPEAAFAPENAHGSSEPNTRLGATQHDSQLRRIPAN
jgi:hypothetical protein